ncbi:hypothetical protein [Tropicimonas aquimaris]|uniref:Uncharacterized protein n=1 Tax=Tropicimonas aquimaris TaxID=914152 RepID=A0ABW3IL93_9RHOB
MSRVYMNVHIALIAALVLLAVAFEATAEDHMQPVWIDFPPDIQSGLVN